MSRGYDARRKAKRRQARADAKPAHPERAPRSRRLKTLVPVFVIAGILAVTAALGIGVGKGTSQGQVEQEVTALLADIPQNGPALGSPRAPITLTVYADLECPTVKLFAEKYLPSMVERWVRTGIVKLAYRSLQTDTIEERTFFKQEIAALAAGRQDRMWNFLLTFVHEQGDEFSGYATDEFFTDIASQVPGLKWARWRKDREDPLLSRQVALGVYSAHANEFRFTPSFSLSFESRWIDRGPGLPTLIRDEFKSSLLRDIASLRDEASGDVPALEVQSEK